MKNKLLPLDIYYIKNGSEIEAELRAYAEGLDALFSELDKMIEENYVSTASDYGISERETFTDREKTTLTLDERRNQILLNEQLVGNNGTLGGFKSFLKSCGLKQFSISENPLELLIRINVEDSLSKAQKALLEEKIFAEQPAHVNVEVFYTNLH